MKKRHELKKIKPKNQEVSEFDFLICPNCGEQEVGKYCPTCGQSNKDFNKPMKEIFDDLLDSINLDIRLINTLIPFFIKPGFLAQEYFKGRRKRYVPPLRLYMFFSIVFFFLAQYVSIKEMDNKENQNEKNNTELSASLTNDAQHVINITDSTDIQKKDSSIQTFNDFIHMSDEMKQEIKNETLSDTTATDFEKEIAVGSLNAVDKLDLFLERFFHYISMVLFALMPLFGLILGMILWRSRLLYVNHLIFSINFHSFIFGLSSLGIALYLILPESISGFISYLGWGVPLYLMIGIKRFYKRSYIGAFFKTVGALSLYSIIISIVLVVMLIFTAKDFY